MARKASGKRKKGTTGGISSEPSPAAEIIASNVDLLTELLLRFPARSLVRFKCVSKHWLSLISDTHFASSHARRRRDPPISALYYRATRYGVPQSDPVSLHRGVHHHHHPTLAFLNGVAHVARINHSCNGLILFVYDHFDGTHYIVCNPTTQSYRLIPYQPDGPSPVWIRPLACLAFDPSKSPHYKVVLLQFDLIDIYSSESGYWKQIHAPGSRIDYLSTAVYWDGAIHWLGDDGVLLRFEVDEEMMITMRNPPRPKILPLDKVRYFGECGGRLILIQARLRSAMGFRILEMDMDCSCWIVKCRVNLRPMVSELLAMDSRIHKFDGFYVLCVVKGEEGKDFELVLSMLGKVISYDLKGKTWELLRDIGRPESPVRGPDAYPYIASLYPV